MVSNRFLASLASALAWGGLASCSNPAPDVDGARATNAQAMTEAQAPLGHVAAGKRLFSEAFPQSNGRSCATCHTLSEHTTLRPASVEARLAADPGDPLFHRIDADDPDAARPTYEHLKKGLVRVVLPLPSNMDVIDDAGNVITPADRKISVWRGVPTIEDLAISGPYQLDGRAATLEEQAQAAILSHSEGHEVGLAPLKQIADFERSVFSSPRARFVSELLKAGVPRDQIPSPEDFMLLTAQEQRGREVFELACAACHGGPTTNQITNRAVHAALSAALKPDGNILFTQVPGQGPVRVRVPRPGNEFVNIGFGSLSYLGQIGQLPLYTSSVELPRYRFRFYTDGTRQHAVTELPPIPVTASGEPFDPTPALDENGLPIVGPNGLPQWFTTDPGRALITGDPLDFEAFDVPPLRGIAGTAPYFHDNSHETLRDVVDGYSQLILPFTEGMNLPPVHPPETPGGLPEALSPKQKQDLLEFLKRL
ncbi:cytochrome c peroxidase [Cystobacter ferrugineus]|uniref:Cytochrome-c peroxidase n=1 Tax=Cystobacter ferrugineus TaxID=83449 RepID=A0A1L9AVE1_9BACT|nr:cytochrome c peroxidase [Cystobacter ferrugineus]OJH33966.1 cytochrome-c peroxidase [Cystobacter ferrugineus]